MTSLSPMSSATYESFTRSSIERFAADNVRSGRWLAEGAGERAAREFAALLPNGMATPDHYFFEIVSSSEQSVGYCWLTMSGDADARAAFVFDIFVEAPHRRSGHARRALVEIEQRAREMGARRIELQVAADNEMATRLYRAESYAVVALHMGKPL